MIKLYICSLVLIIGSVEVGPDIDIKFHQEVMEIVSYDILYRTRGQKQRHDENEKANANRHLALKDYTKPNTNVKT